MSRQYRPDVEMTFLDGPPGSGKSTKLLKDCAGWPQPWAICTFSKDAAAHLVNRGVPKGQAATIYSLSWPHVKLVSTGKAKQRKQPAWQRRKLQDGGDQALHHYEMTAPSKQKPVELLPQLYAWGAVGSLNFVAGLNFQKGAEFALGLARWLDAGAPWEEGFEGYEFIAIDEAQDMGALELCAALALLKPGGKLLAVGDPGQSIFASSKGVKDGDLPPAYTWADHHEVLAQGFRVGAPCSNAAANVLAPYYERPASTFTAKHTTQVLLWGGAPPTEGLVLGLSRYGVSTWVRNHDVRDYAVSPQVKDRSLTVCTIHAAKGAEADDVYLLPWSRGKLAQVYDDDPGLLRLLYVAATRARKRLHAPAELFNLLTRNLI